MYDEQTKDFSDEDKTYIKGVIADWLINGAEGITVYPIKMSGDTGYGNIEIKIHINEYQYYDDTSGGSWGKAIGILAKLEKKNLKGVLADKGY